MGCSSSTSKSVSGSGLGLRKVRSNKSLDSVDISDDEMTKASLDIKNRLEREQALFREIQAEKESLRQVASKMVEQRCSCESLLELLEEAELYDLVMHKDTIKRQKEAHLKIENMRPIKIKDWHLYNNKGTALLTHKIDCINDFMNYALLITSGDIKRPDKKARLSTSLFQPHLDSKPRQASTRQKSLHSRLGIGRNSFINGETVGVEDSAEAINKSNHLQSGYNESGSSECAVSSEFVRIQTTDEKEALRKELLASTVQTISSQNSYYISDININDYEFPPGLITLSSVAAVIELFKFGGRLSPGAVRKLLRLGYRSLKNRPNTTHINLGPNDRLTVVGDIHGQLSDLLHIIDSSGLPSSTSRYLFNGDFVDRGPYGVEVMCVLLAMHAAMPEYVSMNRGNHEDYAICTAYGFQLECYEKYGEVIFGMFVEVFQQIPLFAIINHDVFVLHGGLFHNKQTTIADLNAIDRKKFSLEDMPEGGEGLTEVPRAKRKEFLKQLVRDALWSDPIDQPGMHLSVRGAGIGFGPDVTRNFLKHNNLKFIVRSHECVRSGYNEPYAGENKHLLCTIFSASDYGSSGNSAAFLVFRLHNENAVDFQPKTPRPKINMKLPDVISDDGIEDDSTQSDQKFVENSNLTYIAHYFYIDAEFREGENINDLHKDDIHPPYSQSGRHFPKQYYNAMFELDESQQYFVENEISKSLCVGQASSLFNLILDKKFILLDALNSVDLKKEGLITMTQLAHTFIDTMQVTLDWHAILKILVTENYWKTHHSKPVVDYYSFLNDFVETSVPTPPEEPKVEVAEVDDPNMDALSRYMKTIEQAKATAERERKELEQQQAALHDKKVVETESNVVKIARNNSASMIDISHHISNVQQFSKTTPLTKPLKDSNNFATIQEKLKAPLSIEIPSETNTKHRSLSDHADDNQATTTTLTTISSNVAVNNTNEEIKETDITIDIELEKQSFHFFKVSKEMLGKLYVNYTSLEKAFLYFDRANKGFITKEDVSIGCAEAAEVGLNKRFPNLNVDEIMNAMDIHESGKIDINVFFELFRISDLHLNPPVDIVDEVAGLSIETSSKSSSSNRLRSLSFHQQMASSSSTHSPFGIPLSPLHSGERARSDSHLSIEIKGVSINVDELTTAVAQHSHQEVESDSVDI